MATANDKASVERRRAAHLRKLEAAVEQAVSVLRDRPDVVRIVLFGSLARGTAGSRSDVDLVVVQESEQPFVRRLGEIGALLPSTVGVDVLVYTPSEWDRLRKERPFVGRIDKEGRVLYERSVA